MFVTTSANLGIPSTFYIPCFLLKNMEIYIENDRSKLIFCVRKSAHSTLKYRGKNSKPFLFIFHRTDNNQSNRDSSYLMPHNAISLTNITALQILLHRNNISNASREKVYDPVQETQMQRICLKS